MAQSWDVMEAAKAHLALGRFLLLLFHVGICNITRETWRVYQQQLSHTRHLHKRPKGHSGELQTSLQSLGKSLSRNFGPMKAVAGNKWCYQG